MLWLAADEKLLQCWRTHPLCMHFDVLDISQATLRHVRPTAITGLEEADSRSHMLHLRDLQVPVVGSDG